MMSNFKATPDNIAQAQFALDVKAAVLPLYENIFNVEYPLPKLDTLVVRNPSHFVGLHAFPYCLFRPATLTQAPWKTGA